jgi:hypothetical protein
MINNKNKYHLMNWIVNYKTWNRLFEQAATSSGVTETAMLKWWAENSKSSTANKSLAYWNGGTSTSGGTDKIDGLLSGLAQLEPLKTKLDPVAIKNILDYLNKAKAAGIKVVIFNNTRLGNLLSRISKATQENSTKMAPLISADPGVPDFNKAAGDIQGVVKEIEANKKIVIAMSPQDKQDILAKIGERASAHAKSKGWMLDNKSPDIAKAIAKAESLVVMPSTGESTTVIAPAEKADTQMLDFSYPSKENPSDTLMINFFADNKSVPTEEQVQEFKNLVKAGFAAASEQGMTITEITYNAGAITSKVGTKYLGEGKFAEKSSSENNEILVKDRLSNINKVLLEALTDAAPKEVKVVKIDDESKPNVGPAWYKYVEGDEYGALFNLARKKNSELTPRAFYAQRLDKTKDIDGKIEAEYQSVYSKYRGSYGAFQLIGKAEGGKSLPSTPVVSSTGKWKGTIGWSYREPLKFNFKGFASKGGGTVHPGGIAPTACWKF